MDTLRRHGDTVTGSQFRMRIADGYLEYVWDDGAQGTVADAEESLEAVRLLSDGRRRPLLVDLRPIRSLSRDARERFGDNDLVSKAAFVVDSPLSRIVANFFFAVTRPNMETRMFNTRDDAVGWLLERR